MDITDRIINEYIKDRGLKETYVPNENEMYLIDKIVQLIIK